MSYIFINMSTSSAAYWSQLEGTRRVRIHAVLLLIPTLTLDLWPFNPQTMSLIGYPKVIPYTKFEHFGIIRFRVMLRTNKQTNKQTNKKMDSNMLPTPTDRVCVGKDGTIITLQRRLSGSDVIVLLCGRRRCMTVVRTRWHWRPVDDVTGTGCSRPMNGRRVAVMSRRRCRASVTCLTYDCVIAARALCGDDRRLRTDSIIAVSRRCSTVHVTTRRRRTASRAVRR